MSDSPEVAPLPRASTPTPAQSVRCPRCGSPMGTLEATTGKADAASDVRGSEAWTGQCTDRYCGCCGLIVSIAR